MDSRVEEFRRLAEELKRTSGAGRSTHYPREVRALAVDYGRDRMAQGEHVWRVAKELGVASATLQRWVVTRPDEKKTWRKVRVKRPRPKAAHTRRSVSDGDSGIVVIFPSGVRIEGLDGKMVLAVIEALR